MPLAIARVFVPVLQRVHLGHELDVDHAAARAAPNGGRRRRLRHFLAHGGHGLGVLAAEARRVHRLLDRAQHLLAQARPSRDRSGARIGEALPHLARLPLEVVPEAGGRCHQRPGLADRPKPQVDVVEPPVLCRRDEQVHQLLRHRRRPRVIPVVGGEEDQVEVGAVRELPPAKLAERHDHQARSVHARLATHALERELHDDVRQPAQLLAGLAQVLLAAHVAQPDAQELEVLVVEQDAHRILGHRHGTGGDVLEAYEPAVR